MNKPLTRNATLRKQFGAFQAILTYQAAHVSRLEQENRELREKLDEPSDPSTSGFDSTTWDIRNDKDLGTLITGAVIKALMLYHSERFDG